MYLLSAGEELHIRAIIESTGAAFTTCRWSLSSVELSIVAMLLSSLPPSLCRDIPIYLPKASNKTAHRLVVFTLFEGTSVLIHVQNTQDFSFLQLLTIRY